MQGGNMSTFYWRSASGRRLLIRLFIVSLLLSLLSSSVTLYSAYRSEFRHNEALLQQIRSGYLPALAQSVWSFDIPQVKSQLAALVQFPYIRAAVLDAGNGEHFSAGQAGNEKPATRFCRSGSLICIITMASAVFWSAVYVYSWI
jgi:hypothetical protein